MATNDLYDISPHRIPSFPKFMIPLALLCASAAVHATDGHQLIGIGAIQKGMGGAGVAAPKDSTWVLLNPATIVETHVTAGASYALTENSDIHVAYKHAFGNTLTDNGKGDLFSLLGKGTEIHLEENSMTVEYSYRF